MLIVLLILKLKKMIKWTFNKVVLILLHLFTWVFLHVFIVRFTNYLADSDVDTTSIISLFVVSAIIHYYTFKYMTRRAVCIYVGLYCDEEHS